MQAGEDAPGARAAPPRGPGGFAAICIAGVGSPGHSSLREF